MVSTVVESMNLESMTVEVSDHNPTLASQGATAMRLQLALNVSDIDKAIDFYTRMFGVEPAKTRPGYANFAITDPPLKLVLFEGQGEAGSINHLGVETETTEEVVAAEARLAEADLETTGVADTQCCYAQKTETWLTGPDDARWEWYVKTGDSDQFANLVVGSTGGACCSA
jgi:catechol 2,3-dioxygenase-like lactoylglutathione lyase family enzyme